MRATPSPTISSMAAWIRARAGGALPVVLLEAWLRRSLDFDPPNALYDWTLSTPVMRHLARLVYFHKRGLWSTQAWREILGRDNQVASTRS